MMNIVKDTCVRVHVSSESYCKSSCNNRYYGVHGNAMDGGRNDEPMTIWFGRRCLDIPTSSGFQKVLYFCIEVLARMQSEIRRSCSISI